MSITPVVATTTKAKTTKATKPVVAKDTGNNYNKPSGGGDAKPFRRDGGRGGGGRGAPRGEGGRSGGARAKYEGGSGGRGGGDRNGPEREGFEDRRRERG